MQSADTELYSKGEYLYVLNGLGSSEVSVKRVGTKLCCKLTCVLNEIASYVKCSCCNAHGP